MPRSLDPSSRLTMVLACDADKPTETQPRIFARCLTLNQQRKLMVAMARMQKATNPNEQIESAMDAAEVCLIGWENMIDPATQQAIQFGRETIGDVLTIDELVEVFHAVTSASTPTVSDKKKLELPPSSEAANSANHA